MKKVLVTGSFDPPTLGHNDIIKKCSEIFDEVTVCIFQNAEKENMFSEKERVRMLNGMVEEFGYSNVKVDSSRGYVADYAKENGIGYIARGVRNSSDIEYEIEMASYNKKRNPSLETLFFPASSTHTDVSSTLAREALDKGENLEAFLAPSTIFIISEINKKR